MNLAVDLLSTILITPCSKSMLSENDAKHLDMVVDWLNNMADGLDRRFKCDNED